MDKKSGKAPGDSLGGIMEAVGEAAAALSSAKSPQFYLQMAQWLRQQAQRGEAMFKALPTEAGAVERAAAAQGLGLLAIAIDHMLKDFMDSTLPAEKAKAAMDAIPAKIENATKLMMRALSATAGGKVTDEEITLDEAKQRIAKAIAEAAKPKESESD